MGMGFVNRLFDWILWPIKAVFTLSMNLLRSSPKAQPISGEDQV